MGKNMDAYGVPHHRSHHGQWSGARSGGLKPAGSSGGGGTWNGVVQHAFIIDGMLSGADYQRFAGYVSWAVGLNGSNLPAASPYKNAPPRVAAAVAPLTGLPPDVVASGIVAITSGRNLFAGFAALFLLLLSAATVTPAVLRLLASAASRVAGRVSPIARLVFGDIAASLSRTGVAVAALGMALAAMIGVSIMVESFRESLRDWLAQTMRADIYVTAPGPGAGRPERKIDSEVLKAMLATQGVVDYGMSRRVTVDLPHGPVPLDAVQLAKNGYSNMALTVGDPAVTWPAFEKGEVVISEPLAYRTQLSPGNSLTLSTDAGPQTFRIAGIYREYGNDRGTVLISLPAPRCSIACSSSGRQTFSSCTSMP